MDLRKLWEAACSENANKRCAEGIGGRKTKRTKLRRSAGAAATAYASATAGAPAAPPCSPRKPPVGGAMALTDEAPRPSPPASANYVGCEVSKFFPGHGTFKGTVVSRVTRGGTYTYWHVVSRVRATWSRRRSRQVTWRILTSSN